MTTVPHIPRRPSRGHILYLERKAREAHRQVRIAIAGRLGARVIAQRTRKWQLLVAELEALMKRAAA